MTGVTLLASFLKGEERMIAEIHSTGAIKVHAILLSLSCSLHSSFMAG
jgi:hypothetical protein